MVSPWASGGSAALSTPRLRLSELILDFHPAELRTNVCFKPLSLWLYVIDSLGNYTFCPNYAEFHCEYMWNFSNAVSVSFKMII
jgi:hypothetical protein